MKLSNEHGAEMPLLIGDTPPIRRVRSFIRQAARTDSNVLIFGETGVGKELAAKSIHSQSARKQGPFVKLNCCSLNDSLIEEELFGHKKGAFTGAHIDRPGLVESAHGGTFLFDEIGDISPGFQAKILSVIEDREIRRIGENRPRRVDVRFIFASNRSLTQLVGCGKFREDLYYRISVLEVEIPPLRERTQDIPELIRAILVKESRLASKNITIAQEAIDLLSKHAFPGNVRELENILRRAHESSESLEIKGIDISFCQVARAKARVLRTKSNTTEIIEMLAKCNGNRSKAASMLGISRMHMYRMLKAAKEG